MTPSAKDRDRAAQLAAVLGQSATPQVRTSALSEQAKHEETPTPAPQGPRVRPVRVTVELAPVEHRKLRQWAQDAADDIGVTEVAGAEVVRTLLGLLHEDQALSRRVRAALRSTGGSRRR